VRIVTAQVDFLLAAMRTLAAARPDLKLLLMSATLNSANISEYFAGHVPGAGLRTKAAPAVDCGSLSSTALYWTAQSYGVPQPAELPPKPLHELNR
jgi:hypothetical protein